MEASIPNKIRALKKLRDELRNVIDNKVYAVHFDHSPMATGRATVFDKALCKDLADATYSQVLFEIDMLETKLRRVEEKK